VLRAALSVVARVCVNTKNSSSRYILKVKLIEIIILIIS
jgi:hypothetical protein